MQPHIRAGDDRRAVAAPSWVLMGFEPVRAACEFAGMHLMSRAALPRGDGHAVVLFPGLASDQHAMRPLTSFCRELGYAAYDWGRGFNTGPQGDPDAWLADLAGHVQTLVAPHPAPITLVGWSLGGIYAREIGKLLGGSRVRQVVTIGTPFAGSADETHAGRIYRLLNGREPVLDATMRKRLRTAPEVPTTSIYSRSDGVVAWQACIQSGRRATVENVEVSGSHCGLGWNAQVFGVLADRLSQPPGMWRPYAAAPGQQPQRIAGSGPRLKEA